MSELLLETGAKQVQKALKGDEGGASGSYFPINAVQVTTPLHHSTTCCKELFSLDMSLLC